MKPLLVAGLLAFLALALGGCAGTLGPIADLRQARADAEQTARVKAIEETGDPNAEADPLEVLRAFTVADLKQAIEITPPEDRIAMQCWTALLPIVEAYGESIANIQIKGAFSAFQSARNLRRGQGQFSKIQEDVQLGCAALVNDVRRTIFRVAALVGVRAVGAAATGGIGLPVLPGLPGVP